MGFIFSTWTSTLLHVAILPPASTRISLRFSFQAIWQFLSHRFQLSFFLQILVFYLVRLSPFSTRRLVDRSDTVMVIEWIDIHYGDFSEISPNSPTTYWKVHQLWNRMNSPNRWLVYWVNFPRSHSDQPFPQRHPMTMTDFPYELPITHFIPTYHLLSSFLYQRFLFFFLNSEFQL